jgi:hypothetical protein
MGGEQSPAVMGANFECRLQYDLTLIRIQFARLVWHG